MKVRVQNLLFIAQILLILTVLAPPRAYAAQTATLSVNPSSVVMTYPTYTISVDISPLTNLNSIHFQLSYNNGTTLLDVSLDGVVLGDLFVGTQAEMTRLNIYYRSDTGLSYVDALIEMPGNGTVTSSTIKSIAKITFKLLANAMPGMTTPLKLEWADATFYVGGTNPFEYIDSGKTGAMTLQSGTVTVDYLVTSLTMNSATGAVEKPITLSSTLKDGGGNPLAGLSVDYYVGATKIGSATTNDGGVSSISYTPSDVGTFTIKAEYLHGGKYDGGRDTDTLTVDRRTTTLTLYVQSSIIAGETVPLAATLEKDSIPMSGETIKFYVNSAPQPSAITNSSGTASISYSFNTVGTFVITAEYLGAPKYAPSTDTTTRTTANEKTFLKLTPSTLNPKVGQPLILSAKLTYGTDTPLASKRIEYYVNSTFVDYHDTNSAGLSAITYTPSVASPPEGWEVEARYAGDGPYSSSMDTITIAVSKLPVTLSLSAEPTEVYIEQSIALTAAFKDETSEPISNENIDFYVSIENRWVKIGSKITDGEGIASLIYTPTTTGTLLVNATYAGGSKYPADDSLAMITVNKLGTTLTLNMATMTKVEETIMIMASLKDKSQTPKAIPSVTIEYHLLTGGQDQTIGTAKTDQDGVTSLPYTPTNVGNFTVKATYSETTKHLASSDSRDLTVKTLSTTLVLNMPTTVIVEDTATLLATLKDENDKTLEGLPIKYSIYSGSVWNQIGLGPAATNSTGVATMTYTPSEAGTFRIRAEFGGDSKHSATTSQEVTLTVRRVRTTLTSNLNTTSTKVQTTVKISATLKDEDPQPISRSTINYQILKSGEWINIGSATTNLDGVASMNYQPNEGGTFRVRAIFSGDSKFNASTSEETSLEVTGSGGNSPMPFDLGFLTDDKLTVLDILFWGIIMMAFTTLVAIAIWRKIKSASIQTASESPPTQASPNSTSQVFYSGDANPYGT